ncbi:replication protein [Metabacillus fastidiosus]|uniref:replication protein n=1 Tax=Metabacillus fastidiosus TaxID=1458 RepID=UPI002DB8B9E9|nr:replication protein [Metabacillus fastidiosus]MEC2075836.1 replication protein [Metabacillus fastidiosus]
MEKLKIEETSLVRAKGHVLFHHRNADGWVTLAQKKTGIWKQYHYKPEELAFKLSEWLGEDVYFSQNTFYKPERRIENIRQLRAVYVDVDCYQLNYDPGWVIGKLDLEIFGEILPEPNIIIFSGRGLVCIWLIEPAPHKALPLWQAIQGYFCKQLDYVGADKKSIDATRVFRIAGSINSKNGQEVISQYRHDYRYALRDLQEEYLPELVPRQPKKPGRKPKIVYLHNIRSLHYARLLDLVRLVDLREYNIKGYRELFCFLYRYWGCCLTENAEDSLQQMLEFNSELKEPLPEKEVIRATKSAEKAWLAKSDTKANEEAIKLGYPGAGYNLKNSKIIEWLDITKEEQIHLQTIIDGNEKRRRKRERDKLYQEKKRRDQGNMTREEYIKTQYDKTDNHLFNLQQVLKQNPKAKRKELAELLGVSVYRIDQLKKKLKSL